MPTAACESDDDGRQVCHLDGSIDNFCQDLEIAVGVCSDPRQQCAQLAGHGQQRRPPPGRRPTQATGADTTSTGAPRT